MHEAARSDAVRAIARAGDPDRTLSALFAPRDVRPDLFALYAFNVELARIAEQVSEPDLGAIRLQWWREAVQRAREGEASGHPIADAFGAASRRHDLPAERVEALIDARQFDVGDGVMPDGPSLEAYLRDTAANLFSMAAKIARARGEAVDQASHAAGLAYGLTGLMRALPVHARAGRVYLPAEALILHGTSPEHVLAGETSAGLTQTLADLRDKARGALGEAKGRLAGLDARAQTAFLPLCLVDPYLAALENVSSDPFREIATINPLYRLWRMATWQWRDREGTQ